MPRVVRGTGGEWWGEREHWQGRDIKYQNAQEDLDGEKREPRLRDEKQVAKGK